MSTYSVASLWRYPVKSMRGEELDSVSVTARGLCGDRAYALVDTVRKRVGTGRKFGGLLECRAQFVTPPGSDDRVPAVQITLPDGSVVDSEQPERDAKLTAEFGAELSLVSTAPDGLMLEFAAGSLGGKHIDTTAIPVAGAAPAGTLFDYASVHIITTATLQRLKESYPAGQIAIQRFRPNIVVECPDETGFVENSWLGRTLTLGSELVLRVSIPCPRCVMTTLPQGDLPHDPRILRTLVDQNRLDLGDFGHLPCAGVYADVVQPGDIRRGDRVQLAD
ncbi:MAG: MOSC N-terminal beta barrel domain-containing protein [Burkholderiales bacterium]